MTVFNEIQIAKQIPDLPFSPKALRYDDKFKTGFLIIQPYIQDLVSFECKNEDDFVNYCKQFNFMLDRLFDIKLVHCDVHKGNLMLNTKNKTIYLLDYGISKFVNRENKIDYLARPGTFYKTMNDGNKVIRRYDDAYSFVCESERMGIPESWKTNEPFLQIERKIGRLYVDIVIDEEQ